MVLKQLVGRTIHGEFLSYPSGHTAAFVALGLVLGLLFGEVLGAGRWTGVLVVVSASITGAVMAWAQIVLTAHYPTDALGGAGCAAVVLPATALLVDRLGQSVLRRAAEHGLDRPPAEPRRRVARVQRLAVDDAGLGHDVHCALDVGVGEGTADHERRTDHSALDQLAQEQACGIPATAPGSSSRVAKTRLLARPRTTT